MGKLLARHFHAVLGAQCLGGFKHGELALWHGAGRGGGSRLQRRAAPGQYGVGGQLVQMGVGVVLPAKGQRLGLAGGGGRLVGGGARGQALHLFAVGIGQRICRALVFLGNVGGILRKAVFALHHLGHL